LTIRVSEKLVPSVFSALHPQLLPSPFLLPRCSRGRVEKNMENSSFLQRILNSEEISRLRDRCGLAVVVDYIVGTFWNYLTQKIAAI